MSRHICETNNYGKFVMAEFNRPVSLTRKLEASMRKDGFWDDEPILVRRNGSQLIILRGQHRFYVARKLGLPIKYLETKREVNIPIEEGIKRPWSIRDYLFSYCQMGVPAYLKIKEYHEQTGISLGLCVSMLAGNSAGSGNQAMPFRNGTYRLGNQSHARVVADIVGVSRASGYPFWSHNLYVQAVSRVAWAEGFSSEVLKDKIRTHSHFMKKQASKQDFVEMLDSIYNRQSHMKVPLAFLAEEAARKRNVITPR